MKNSSICWWFTLKLCDWIWNAEHGDVLVINYYHRVPKQLVGEHFCWLLKMRKFNSIDCDSVGWIFAICGGWFCQLSAYSNHKIYTHRLASRCHVSLCARLMTTSTQIHSTINCTEYKRDDKSIYFMWAFDSMGAFNVCVYRFYFDWVLLQVLNCAKSDSRRRHFIFDRIEYFQSTHIRICIYTKPDRSIKSQLTNYKEKHPRQTMVYHENINELWMNRETVNQQLTQWVFTK